MPASPIRETIAKIAREEAVVDLAASAMATARRLGQRPVTHQGMVEEIIAGGWAKMQARALLASALISLHRMNSPHRRILALLTAEDHTHCDNHERMADLWDEIAGIVEEQWHECREYAEADQ